MGVGVAKGDTIIACARAHAQTLRDQATDPASRAQACLDLLAASHSYPAAKPFQKVLAALPADERHYWVGTLYTLMLTKKMRRAQATYFTPPAVADAVVELAVEHGFDLAAGTVLDPAAGGAAFLSTIAARMVRDGLPPERVIHRLNGVEIDEGLAQLSRGLIAERLGIDLPRPVIVQGDALKHQIPASYSLVIANPPYGRVSLDAVHGEAWRKVAHSGHINKYALFAELCFRMTAPDGLVVLVIPSSFRAGPLYDRMREFIRREGEVLAIASIEGRDGVFIDVAQDISVLVARKGQAHRPETSVRFPSIGSGLAPISVVERQLPERAGDAWPLPPRSESETGGANLADYGVTAKAGYFVWNREGERLHKALGALSGYPLIWARNVKPGQLCVPAGKNGAGADFVAFEKTSQAVVTGPAAVLQRTTNDKQTRRLVAAVVDPAVVGRWGGFVTENHTIVLTSDDEDGLARAVALLNTAAVDRRYRQVSGTAAVSVTLLRKLDLPHPDAFRSALAKCDGDAEKAAELAYGARQPAKVE